jgi:hypothetical protein
MATIANLDVNLRARTQKYETNMKNAGKSTRRFSDTTRNAARGTESFQGRLTSLATKGAIATAAIGVMGAAVNKLVQDYAKLGDEIGKAAARTQLSTDDLQSLSFAFEQSGGSVQNLETAIKSMSTQYLDLQRGTATSTDLFNRLGITLNDLEGLDVGERFRLIAKSISNIQDPTEKAAVAVKLFGRSGSTILPLIKNLDATEQQFKDLGLTIDQSLLRTAEDLTDKNNILKRSFEKMKAEVGSALTPAAEGFNNILIKVNNTLSSSARGMKEFVRQSRGLPQIVNAINGATDSEFQAFLNRQAQQPDSRIVKRRLKVQDPLSESGSSFLIDRQINTQKQLIETLKNQNNKLAPLPQALQRGTSAQIGFVAQLQRQNQQAKMEARDKKKIDLAEKHLKELEKIRKQREEEFKDKVEVDIL